MKHATRLVTLSLSCLVLVGTRAQAQVKDMPSQAELDPILDNADSKVKDFVGTLTKYRAEAGEIDNERLEKDLHAFGQLREMIQQAHGGPGNHGMTFTRMFAIVASTDDAALEAATWSNLLTARVCSGNRQSVLFAVEVESRGGMLREVSGQLFHPTFRMMGAAR